MAFEASKRMCKHSIGQMFSIESALVKKKKLLKWFYQKFKRQFDKINPIKKFTYESQNQIHWQKDKCIICKFSLKLEPANYKTSDDKMSFGDFLIRYEHKFLRNIYTDKQLQDSHHLKNLENYYKTFNEYIMICIGLLALLNNFNKLKINLLKMTLAILKKNY